MNELPLAHNECLLPTDKLKLPTPPASPPTYFVMFWRRNNTAWYRNWKTLIIFHRSLTSRFSFLRIKAAFERQQLLASKRRLVLDSHDLFLPSILYGRVWNDIVRSQGVNREILLIHRQTRWVGDLYKIYHLVWFDKSILHGLEGLILKIIQNLQKEWIREEDLFRFGGEAATNRKDILNQLHFRKGYVQSL